MLLIKDKNIVLTEKKKTREKVALLLNKNKDVILARKKRTWRKKKIYLKKKKRYTKKTPFVIGLEFDKIKSDSVKGSDSKVLNAESIVRPVFKLSNTGNKARSDSSNGEGE